MPLKIHAVASHSKLSWGKQKLKQAECDFGEYLNVCFNAIVVVFFFLILQLKIFLIVYKFFCQKESLLTYLLYPGK